MKEKKSKQAQNRLLEDTIDLKAIKKRKDQPERSYEDFLGEFQKTLKPQKRQSTSRSGF